MVESGRQVGTVKRIVGWLARTAKGEIRSEI